MPHDDYTASTGGSLKLKGVNPASKISKPHKKKRPKPPQPAESSGTALGTAKQAEKEGGDEIVGERYLSKNDGSEQRENEEVDGKSLGVGDGRERSEEGVILGAVGKTEAERRHEERRRRRLDERLKREGTKTHKERVEELNRYLSNLSEHHDMPRIGPG